MKYTNREIKLSAAVYTTSRDLVEHVIEHGTLPKVIPLNGFPIAMKKIIEWRGIDLELTDKVKLVYDAILASGRLPGGVVNLVEDHPEDLEYSIAGCVSSFIQDAKGSFCRQRTIIKLILCFPERCFQCKRPLVKQLPRPANTSGHLLTRSAASRWRKLIPTSINHR